MSFKKFFCSSPWFHVKISNSGHLEYCRWASRTTKTEIHFYDKNYKQQIDTYFKKDLSNIRSQFLQGQFPKDCEPCGVMEKYNKISGRQKQLLKIGIDQDHFEKSLLSSNFKQDFDYSLHNKGQTLNKPVDWQIDLGNYCNSACVFCGPESSSKIAQEYHKLGFIEQYPLPNWSDNENYLQDFIEYISEIEDLKYLHFIGGETLITPGFKNILQGLIRSGISKNVSIGFTTNLSKWRQDVVDLLDQFKEINLGVSIETLTEVNDYVRYPSRLNEIKQNLAKWTNHARSQNWLMQIRTTPTCLSIHDLLTVYDYVWENKIGIESCNFLMNPEIMRISVLPRSVRTAISEKFKLWLKNHSVEKTTVNINIRDQNQYQNSLIYDLESYVHYLDNAQDESFRLPELVKFLKRLETNRHNSILDYIPQYENLFRSAGY